MEKHFLDEMMEGSPEFRPEPWYNSAGDCIVYQTADEAIVADRVDGLLTVYRSAVDGRPIGFQIKGVQAMLRKFGWDALAIRAETEAGQVRRISIAALLLAAYEDGPKTMERRMAYASIIPDQTIAIDDLIPA